MYVFKLLNFSRKKLYLKKYNSMKYLQINPQLFIKNRKKFAAQMVPNSIAVFNSNDIFSTGADSTLPFHQHRNIFYLSGVDQEESILVLCPDAKNNAHKEILFLKETNDHIAIWEGAKLTKKQATEISGVQTIYWLDEFEIIFEEVLPPPKLVTFRSLPNRFDLLINWLSFESLLY